MSFFKMTSDLTLAYSPLHIVIPQESISPTQIEELTKYLHKPLRLTTPTKEEKDFDIMENLMELEVLTDGDRPVVVVNWTEEGWDRLAYLFLKNMAHQVKTTPKKMPRKMRTFANLMDKLTEKPTGNGKVDASRRIVIERTIEDLAPGVRNEVEARVKNWSSNKNV